MSYLYLIIGAIVGFFVAKFFSGKRAGEQGRLKSLKFSTKKYVIHLHHWLLALVALLFLLAIGWRNWLVYGFLTGLIIQGLTYRDFYRIIYHQDKFDNPIRKA